MTVEVTAKINDKHPTRNKIGKIGAGSTQTAHAPRSIALWCSVATDHRLTTTASGANIDIANGTLVLVFSIR
jgi:hypothetical protein